MDLEFILDEDYLAYFILSKKMYNESKEIEDIKNKLYKDNNIGYKKILEEELLDVSIYLKDNNIKVLIDEFITTDKYNEIYKDYSNESKEVVAIKILRDIIRIEDKDLIKLKDDLWYKYMDGYKSVLNLTSFNVSVFLLDNDVKEVINYLKNTDIYKKLYKETKEYLINIKKYWEANEDFINKYLEKALKIDFNIKPKVYIMHPSLCEGYSINNEIIWGHYKGLDDPNYNLVYLTHEWLHCLLPFTEEDTEIDCNIKHTIIELISDYELYSLLKKESTLKQGHPYLEEYKKIIYPYWLNYIGLKDNEIKVRLERDSIDSNDIDVIESIDFSNINIEDFIDYCTKEYMLFMNNNSNKRK